MKKDLKKEYLRRHAESSDYLRCAVQSITIATTSSSSFKTPFLRERNHGTAAFPNYQCALHEQSNSNYIHYLIFIFRFTKTSINKQQKPIEVDLELEEQSSLSIASNSSQFQLSKSHQSTCSSWEYVHALNVVTEAQDLESNIVVR